jgi:N-acetylneuraminic acid mutarotase
MRYRLLLPSVLSASVLALAACGEEAPTEPTIPTQPTASVPELAVASNTWITRADLLVSRSNVTLATVTNASGQSVVYAIGGRNPNRRPLTTVTAYNVATNTWHFRHALPAPLANTNGAGVINGKIYVSGGLLDYTYDTPSHALYMYDPNTDTWTRKHDMPSVQGPYHDPFYVGAQGVTGVISGKLYVVTQCYWEDQPKPYFGESGCYGTGVGPAFFRYDPVTDHWDTLPSPFGSYVAGPFAGGVIGGKLYVMGGSPWGEGHMAAYDPATKQWTTKNALGKSRPGAGTAVLGGKLYVIGGRRYNPERDAFDTLDKTIVYDPMTNLWTTRAPMPSPREDITGSTVRLNGQARIEVVGGSLPGNNLQYVP